MSITVQLAHFSDCHSHFDGAPMSFSPVGEGQWRTQCGGYARLLTRLTQLRAKAAAASQRFLFLHGGDSFQGSLYFNRFKGRANADLLAMLAPDAMVLGNHEFDLGNGPLVEFLRQLDFPVLAANLDNSQEPADTPLGLWDIPHLYDAHQPWHRRVIDGVPFALLGITLAQMAAIANPDPHTRFHAVADTLTRVLREIKREGIQHIVLLSHLGLDQDKLLAERFPELSLIIGGHTHSLLGDLAPLGLPSEGSYPLMNNGWLSCTLATAPSASVSASSPSMSRAASCRVRDSWSGSPGSPGHLPPRHLSGSPSAIRTHSLNNIWPNAIGRRLKP